MRREESERGREQTTSSSSSSATFWRWEMTRRKLSSPPVASQCVLWAVWADEGKTIPAIPLSHHLFHFSTWKHLERSLLRSPPRPADATLHFRPSHSTLGGVTSESF